MPPDDGYLVGEVFFFQAEDGIRDPVVTGVQTCALPIYRMALDHPARVERLAVLNVLPTVDQFERMAAEPALDYYPWFFLAQPAPLPERLIAPNAEFFLRHTLASWCGTPGAIDPEAAAAYVRAF